MANDLNRCEFIGRLGKDPEIRYLPDGRAVANFSVACGKQWKDKVTGERKESVEWILIVMFGRLAEIAGQYLSKGSQIWTSGEMRTRRWQDKNGQDRYTTEIVASEMQMLGSRQDGQDRPAQRTGQNAGTAAAGNAASADFDDDIPF